MTQLKYLLYSALTGFEPVTYLCDTDAERYQLSYQAKWELAIL